MGLSRESASSAIAARLPLCIAFYILYFSSPAKAQEISLVYGGYALKHYTAETGLSQNSVKAIVRDEAGFFWFGTEDGLARFDGRYFHTFNTANSKLNANRISQSFRGPFDGKAYFLTDTQRAFRVSSGNIIDTNLKESQLTKLHVDITKPLISTFLANELSNRHTYRYFWQKSLLVTAPGQYYLCDTSSVARFENGAQLYRTHHRSEDVLDFFTLGADLYHFDRPNGRITRVDSAGSHPVSITGDAMEDSGGPVENKKPEVLWNIFSQSALLSLGRKIYRIDRIGTDHFNTKILLDGFDTDENRIISSYYDNKSGLLLLGSHTKGLFVFTKKTVFDL